MQEGSIDIGCFGKQKFDAWKKAELAMKKTAHSQGNCSDKRKLSVYRCKSCNSLHIGGSDNPYKGK